MYIAYLGFQKQHPTAFKASEATSNPTTGDRLRYCKCNKLVVECQDDQMVMCSNNKCSNSRGQHNANWFHFECVGFNPNVDKEYYCLDACRPAVKPAKKQRR